MGNAITMGILWHLIGAASAACFMPLLKGTTLVTGDHVVHRRFCFMVDPATARQRNPTARLLGLLQFIQRIHTTAGIFIRRNVGIGNINYGLTMRYLGMSMGIGIAIGITLIVGTLMTPIIAGKFDVLIGTPGGRMTLLGVLVALIGVAIVTRAGQLKERKMGIKAEEFNLKKV